MPAGDWADEFLKLTGPEMLRVAIPAEFQGGSGTFKAWSFLREWAQLWTEEGTGLTTRVRLSLVDLVCSGVKTRVFIMLSGGVGSRGVVGGGGVGFVSARLLFFPACFSEGITAQLCCGESGLVLGRVRRAGGGGSFGRISVSLFLCLIGSLTFVSVYTCARFCMFCCVFICLCFVLCVCVLCLVVASVQFTAHKTIN